jgi:glycosyl transferase family 7 (putative galactosyltransferase)
LAGTEILLVQENFKNGNMIFLSAQPDDLYFIWQLEVQLNNFKRAGINPGCIHVLIGVDPQEGLKAEFHSLISRRDLASFFIYPDTRIKPQYAPGVRPQIIKQHFKENPWMEQESVFYHDCDIIFRELPDMSELEADSTWYVSDTRNYLDSKYILKHGRKVLDDMCAIVGIDKQLVISGDEEAGGAQYILKGTNYAFWDKVEKDAENLFTHLEDHKGNYARIYSEETGQDPEGYGGIQDWCADMWALLWNGLLKGASVKISKELDFCWPKDDLHKWEELKIFHNSGITIKDRKKYFCKSMFTFGMPYFEDLSYLDKTSCNVKYVEEIERYGKSWKADLTDTTILIPIRIDSGDRLENLHTVLRFLNKWFETNIIILEADVAPRLDKEVFPGNVRYYFHDDDRPFFYHTLYNNLLANLCTTPYASIYDADMVMLPNQLAWAVEYLRYSDVSLVYPYDGRFYFVDRGIGRLFGRQLDFGILYNYWGCLAKLPVESFGGVCVFDLAVYKRLGMDNINLVGWGPEDRERHKRFTIAGEKIKRIDGPIYHLDHARKEASWHHNKELEIRNKLEYLKICNMDLLELRETIGEWKKEGYRAPALVYI